MRALLEQKKQAEESVPEKYTTHLVVDFELPNVSNLVPDTGEITGDPNLQPPKAPRADARHQSHYTYAARPRLSRSALAFVNQKDGYFALEPGRDLQATKELLAFQYRVSDARSLIVVELHASRNGGPLGIFQFKMRPAAANEWRTVQLDLARLKLLGTKAPAATKPPVATAPPASAMPSLLPGMSGGGESEAQKPVDRLAPGDLITEWRICAEPAYVGLEFYVDNIFFTAGALDNEFRRRVGLRIPRERQSPQ
jgi:hypothetical protein